MPFFALNEGRPFKHPDAEQFISDMETAGFEPLFDGARRSFGYVGPFVRVPVADKKKVEVATNVRLIDALSTSGHVDIWPSMATPPRNTTA